MIDGLSVLAVIPARGGSKGLPGKNIRLAAGRPLLDYTVAAARASRHVDRVVLSSDDEEIMRVARECGCEVPFRRPGELATDEAASIDVVLHALDQLPPHDLVVLLQPTSPLRSAADIDGACRTLQQHGAPACVSVTAAEQSPYWMFRMNERAELAPLLPAAERAVGQSNRRQDLPPVFVLNGAVYVARCEWLKRERSFVAAGTVGYPMPAERSLDIDTPADFETFVRLVS